MSDRRQRQQALIGGIIVRRGAARVRSLIKDEWFDSDIDRRIFRAADSLSKIGLDKDDEYICRISQTVFFEDGRNAYIGKLIEAFELEADEQGPGSTLEQLAEQVATERRERASA